MQIDRTLAPPPRTNRDAVLRLKDGATLRASRTYIDGLLGALRGGR